MSEIKIMVVPGKIATVELTTGMTVIDACQKAEQSKPGVGWEALAKDREVRVQNRKFSNTNEVPDGYFGSISETPLNEGDVILIIVKIKGNVGLGVLTCVIDGQEFALETPDTVASVLANVAGYDLDNIKAVYINGDGSPFDQLVGSGDEISVEFYPDPDSEDMDYTEDFFSDETVVDPEPETVTVTIDGHTVTGRPADIRRILGC